MPIKSTAASALVTQSATYSQATQTRHFAALDGLRGVAIVLVLAFHFSVNLWPGTWLGAAMERLSLSGWIGVDLFFVLSGFLITRILADTVGSEGFFRVFYMRRFLRIFPLYYGLLFAAMALTQPLQIAWHHRQWIYLLYLQNSGLDPHIQRVPLSPMFGLNHLWSLAVEEQFYLLWPVLVWWLRDTRTLLRVAIVGSVLSLALRICMTLFHIKASIIYLVTPCRVDSLLIGGALALWFRIQPIDKIQKWAMPAFLCSAIPLFLIGVLSGGVLDHLTNPLVMTIGFTCLAVASAAVIAALCGNPTLLTRSMLFPPLRWMGKHSYGVYVFHVPVLKLAAYMLLGVSAVSVHGIALCVTLMAAALSFRFVEKPILLLKRYFEYRQKTDRPNDGAQAYAAGAK